MSVVHNFVLIVPCGTEPFRLPWADECTPDAPRVARWHRIDLDVFGDAKGMELRVYGLVVNMRDPEVVIEAFRVWSSAVSFDLEIEEATLVVKRQHSDGHEVYSSKDGAPRLTAAARERGSRGLV